MSQQIESALSAWVQTRLSNTKSPDNKSLNNKSPDNKSPDNKSPDKSTAVQLKPLNGDAGQRRYFQIAQYPEYLAVYAPPESENTPQFVLLANYLRQQSVQAPQVIAVDEEQGFLIIENLGERLLLSQLDSDSVELHYAEALMTLLSIQQAPRSLPHIEDYSRAKLLQEMQLFPQWFVQDLLGYSMSPAETALLTKWFDVLLDSALNQPQCFVHRDYHSRNLICRDVGTPGVIDFQDGVWGPVTYDLVSLLRDCYVRWPEERVQRWAITYANMAVEVGIIDPVPMATFQRWFDLMGLQRHIKVLGIFARLALRDKKSGYLQDLPLVLRYTFEVASRYPEANEFVAWLNEKLLPLIEQQSWYRDYRTAGFAP